jgi:DNA repair protein RadC
MKDTSLEIDRSHPVLSCKVQQAISELQTFKVSEIPPEHQDQLLDLSNRIAQKQLEKGAQITSPTHSRASIRDLLQKKQEEVMAVLFLDSKHRIISFEELFP